MKLTRFGMYTEWAFQQVVKSNTDIRIQAWITVLELNFSRAECHRRLLHLQNKKIKSVLFLNLNLSDKANFVVCIYSFHLVNELLPTLLGFHGFML
jgi:hypothetical protein